MRDRPLRRPLALASRERAGVKGKAPAPKPATSADKHPFGETDIRLRLLLASFKLKDGA